jgi:hypothetical protein
MVRKIPVGFVGFALAFGFLACQTDIVDQTPIGLLEEEEEEYDPMSPGEWEYPAIYGRCWDEENTSQPVYMAKVTWFYGQDVLGYCITRMDGWYRISDIDEELGIYVGENLDSDAEHSLYSTTSTYIVEYEYPNNYQRNYYMNPDPGHSTLTTNGKIKGRVQREDNGVYIYPACVTVYGDDYTFLGYDTT